MSDFAAETVASGVGAVFGVSMARGLVEDADAVRCMRIEERALTRRSATFMEHQLSPLLLLLLGIFFGIGWISSGGIAGKNGNQLDVIATYCMAAGFLLMALFGGSLRRVTRRLESEPGAAGRESDAQDATDNPLSPADGVGDNGPSKDGKGPAAAGELFASATDRKLRIHGSVSSLVASYDTQDYLDAGDVLVEGHLEDLGMGSVLISTSSSASLERWTKFLTGLTCFVIFAAVIVECIGVFKNQFLRWGSLGLFMGIVLPNLAAWFLLLKVASSLVADAVSSLWRVHCAEMHSHVPDLTCLVVDSHAGDRGSACDRDD